MSEKLITVLTPTYNRGENLKKLYNSLKKQENKNFIWYIVDDGSKDNTESIVKGFLNEGFIDIRYKKKHNGGKHTAINVAMKDIKTPLTFIVDSDDWLTENAIQCIAKYYEKYKNDKELCGFSFLRKFPNGEINDKKFPINEKKESFIESRINGNIAGDKAEVFFSMKLREFPFPEFRDEKFISEDIVWIKMALKYKMIHINEPIYISDYLEGGLTKSGRKMRIKSPKGGRERSKMLMIKECNLKTRIKGTILYIIYSKFDKKNLKEILKDTEYKGLVIFFYIVSIIIYFIWEKKYEDK